MSMFIIDLLLISSKYIPFVCFVEMNLGLSFIFSLLAVMTLNFVSRGW